LQPHPIRKTCESIKISYIPPVQQATHWRTRGAYWLTLGYTARQKDYLQLDLLLIAYRNSVPCICCCATQLPAATLLPAAAATQPPATTCIYTAVTLLPAAAATPLPATATTVLCHNSAPSCNFGRMPEWLDHLPAAPASSRAMFPF
jgi:hypothetical protein